MSAGLDLREAIRRVRDRAPGRHDAAVVLGSGLGGVSRGLQTGDVIDTADLPGYPRPGVEGHRGEIGFSTVEGLRVIVFRGRIHLYERGSVPAVLAPILLAHGLGARALILTNAAGGIRQSFAPGDLMVIEDHLNLTFRSPGRGTARGGGRPIYDPPLVAAAVRAGRRSSSTVHQGVYAGVLGPTYETAAEIAMLRQAGADAVGMSTVLEAEQARLLSMRVMALSVITNRATGTGGQTLSHDEVTLVGKRASTAVEEILLGVLKQLGEKAI